MKNGILAALVLTCASLAFSAPAPVPVLPQYFGVVAFPAQALPWTAEATADFGALLEKLGEKAGLDWDLMLDVLANSAVGSGVVKSKISLLKSRNYGNPSMSLHNIVKDLDLALTAGAEVDVELPATKRVRELYEPAMKAGLEWKDYAAVLLEMETRAGLEAKETES